jgi:hypothetical protein
VAAGSKSKANRIDFGREDVGPELTTREVSSLKEEELKVDDIIIEEVPPIQEDKPIEEVISKIENEDKEVVEQLEKIPNEESSQKIENFEELQPNQVAEDSQEFNREKYPAMEDLKNIINDVNLSEGEEEDEDDIDKYLGSCYQLINHNVHSLKRNLDYKDDQDDEEDDEFDIKPYPSTSSLIRSANDIISKPSVMDSPEKLASKAIEDFDICKEQKIKEAEDEEEKFVFHKFKPPSESPSPVKKDNLAKKKMTPIKFKSKNAEISIKTSIPGIGKFSGKSKLLQPGAERKKVIPSTSEPQLKFEEM